MELWESLNNFSLPPQSNILRYGVVVSIQGPFMGKKELFNNLVGIIIFGYMKS